ncbi:MAG: carboxypeptidase regulatory-like domain-containing protein [Verrucomicrobiota bacterium]
MKCRPKFIFLLAAVAPWLGTAYSQSVVEGIVKSPGPAANPPPNARYQIKTSGPVASPETGAAVVYLEGTFPPAAATNAPSTAELGQKNFQFAPGLLPIRKGTAVQFPNYDGEYHNVLSYSKAKEFDLGRYLKGEKPPSLVFDQPGLVELNCEIHEHMRGYILVLDTPYFTKTDAGGKYRLENLPAGKHILKAWINPKTVWAQPVELKPAATLQVNFQAP